MGDSLTILVLVFFCLAAVFFRLGKIEFQTPIVDTSPIVKESISEIKVLEGDKETAKLMERLKTVGLWELSADEPVPLYIVNSYPGDFHILKDVKLRKKIFLHTLLPSALVARHEVILERMKLQAILDKIDCSSDAMNFIGSPGMGQCSWQNYLAEDEVRFVVGLSKNYRTKNVHELLKRVDPVPVSLILAQGALETSWGRSRFAREGNSIFGMWTWKTKGMVPNEREEGKTHKVKMYDSILDSVRAYQLTLNRLKPYDHLRYLRLETDDSLVLAEGLTLYSQRGGEYVRDIKKVILSNDLQFYDRLSLEGSERQKLSEAISGINVVRKAGKASL
jgi:Bax protein